MAILNENTIVEVTNRDNGSVIYRIPEKRIRREFYPKETKRVPYGEILDVIAQPGGRELIYNFLFIHNPEAVRESLNIQEPPEYWLSEEQIPTWINSCTLDEFKDALDFAPEGVKNLIKKYSVEVPLNDNSKREAVLEILKFDVTKAIANNKLSNESNEDVESEVTTGGKTRRTAGESITKPKERVITIPVNQKG